MAKVKQLKQLKSERMLDKLGKVLDRMEQVLNQVGEAYDELQIALCDEMDAREERAQRDNS